MKKILQITKTYHPYTYGGVETVIHKINILLGKNYKFDILSTNRFADTIIKKKNTLHYSFRENLNFFSSPFSLNLLIHFYKNKNIYSLINFHYPWPLMNLCVFFLKKKIKKVVTYHADAISGNNLIDILYFPFAYFFLKKMDKIIVTSKQYYSSSKILKFFKKKIKIIPNFIEIKKVNKIDDKNYVLFLGALRKYKGFDVIRDTAKLVNYKFILAGHFTKKDIIKYNFSKNVKFIFKPSEKKKNELLKSCSLLILPSTNRLEAFGLTLLEAANFKKPVISSNLSTGVNSIIKNNFNGFLIRPNDCFQLVKKINFLMQNIKIRKKMGLNNHKILINKFDSNNGATKYRKLYNNLLSIK